MSIISPNISIHNKSSKPTLTNTNYYKKIYSIFSDIKNQNISIDNIYIKEAVITLEDKVSIRKVILQSSQSNINYENNLLYLNTNNIFLSSKQKNILHINSNCTFQQDLNLRCNNKILDINTKIISKINKKLYPLSYINSDINGTINFTINSKYDLSNTEIYAKTSKGKLVYPQIFDNSIEFNNLVVNGSFTKETNNNYKINAKFILDNSQFNISSTINNTKEIVEITGDLIDMRTQKLYKLLPKVIIHNPILRKSKKLIPQGLINHATIFTKFDKKQKELKDLNINIKFSDLKLIYSNNFPEISNINGIASITDKNTTVKINSGNVLQSKIKSASIKIIDYKSNLIDLEIDSYGKSYDIFKHIPHFRKNNNINQYINGNANTTTNIKLHIKNNLTLNDIKLKIKSHIDHLNTKYTDFDSELLFEVAKKFNSNKFIAKINLLNSNVSLPKIGFHKNKGVPSTINLVLSIKNHILMIENFIWRKGESFMKGDLFAMLPNIHINYLNIENNFGKNDYIAQYYSNQDTQSLTIRGETLDLSSIIKQSRHNNQNSIIQYYTGYTNNKINVNLSKIIMINRHNFRNVLVNINCKYNICKKGTVKSDLKDRETLIFNIDNNNNKHSTITGTISNIATLFKTLNISDKIISGGIKIKGKIDYKNDKIVINGNIKNYTQIHIKKEFIHKKIMDEDIFKKIKQKKTNKVAFRELESDIEIKDSKLFVKDLIISSLLLGATSNGNINLANKELKFSGLLIPGYILNSLFGITRLPIISTLIGDKGGGIFAIQYTYSKSPNSKSQLDVLKSSIIIPGVIRNLLF